MNTLAENIQFGGNVYNALCKRRVMPCGMIYCNGGWTIKIPRKLPIRDGVLLVVYIGPSCMLEIRKISVWGRWLYDKLLDEIDCSRLDDSKTSLNMVCDLIEKHHRPSK